MSEMIKEKSWSEFRHSGLLWLINQSLHVFGWAIVFETDTEDKDKVVRVYPARVKFRGFDEASNTKGYENVSKYLKENIDEIEKEARE